MKIAIIGTGNLGLSIAKGLVINNTYTTLYLTKRNLDTLSNWKEYKNVTLTKDNSKALSNADIVIFAVQPSQFGAILNEIKPILNDKHVLISTITGYTFGRMETHIVN